LFLEQQGQDLAVEYGGADAAAELFFEVSGQLQDAFDLGLGEIKQRQDMPMAVCGLRRIGGRSGLVGVVCHAKAPFIQTFKQSRQSCVVDKLG
jgi:hypothetical protein